MVVVDVEVCTSLDIATQEVGNVALRLALFIIETVVAPHGGIVHRTVHVGCDGAVVVFGLAEDALLHGVARVVAIHLITHVQFLVYPAGVSCCCVVLGIHRRTVLVVHEVMSAQQVSNLCRVVTAIPAEVHTAVHVPVLVDLVLVGRKQTRPQVVVVLAAKGQHTALVTCYVAFVQGIVIEVAVGRTEVILHLTVLRTIIVCIRTGSVSFCRCAPSSSDAHVQGCGQAAMVVDGPIVVQRELRFVVFVLCGIVFLAVQVAKVGVVLIVLVAILLAHASPFGNGQWAVVHA